ncbi:CHAT domain-containing tetratricopeptide repeat protein [Novipirellula herctigrandis]
MQEARNAVVKAEQILQNANEAGDPAMVQVLGELAILERVFGRLEDALKYAKRAISLADLVLDDDSTERGHLLYTLAMIESQLGDQTSAIESLNRAICVFEDAGSESRVDIAMSTSSLAAMYDAIGNIPQAETHFMEALHHFDAKVNPNPIDQPIVYSMILTSVGAFYRDIGDYDKASKYLLQSVKQSEQLHGSSSIPFADALKEYAFLLKKRGQLHEAQIHYRRVLAIEEDRLGKTNPNIAFDWHMLGGVMAASGENKAAIDCDLKAIELYENVNAGKTPFMATLLNNLAWSHLREGNFGEGEKQLDRALKLYLEIHGSEHSETANALSTRSVLKAHAGKLDGAIADLKQATKIYERIIRLTLDVGSDKAKLNFLRSLEGKTNLAYCLHFQFAPNNQNAARLALETILQRKGRVMEVLRDRRRHLSRTKHVDEGLVEQLGTVKAELSKSLLQTGGVSHEAKLRIHSLKDKQDQLERQLVSSLGSLGVDYQEPSLASVAQGLPTKGVLLEYVKYWDEDLSVPQGARASIPRRYGVYLLRSDQTFEFALLGKADRIDSKIIEFRKAIADRSEAETRRLGKELYELLVFPLHRHLADKRQILISPDSFLNLLPFCALIDDRDRFLIEDFELTYLGCGRDLIRLSSEPTKREAVSPMFIVANPATDAELGEESTARRSRHHETREFTSLPGAEAEGKAIKRMFPAASLVSGKEASEYIVKSLKSPQMVHVASHGFFLPRIRREVFFDYGGGKTMKLLLPEPLLNENPLVRSGLVMAGADHFCGGHGDDGILTALELSNVDLSGTELAVLSACQTAVGEVYDGEGVFGLRRALVLAGARTQVISLWNIDDQSTSVLMQQFYKNLQNGQSRSEAIRSSQLSLLRNDYKSPIHWAVFQLSGDWRSLNLD